MSDGAFKSLSWIGRLVFIQVVLIQMSIPLLISWGLPISTLTLLSNVIFAPFLSFFIGISALIFFCELCSIPYGYLKILLIWISDWWMYFLNFGSHRWLIGLCAPHIAYLWALGIGSFLLLLYVQDKPLWYKNTIFVGLLASTLIFFHFFTPPRFGNLILKTKKKALVIERDNGITNIIDYGLLSKRNPYSWLNYTLRPEVVRFSGSLHIHKLVCKKPTRTTLTTITALLHCFVVDTVIIPLSKSKQRQFADELDLLLKTAQAEHTKTFLHL